MLVRYILSYATYGADDTQLLSGWNEYFEIKTL